MRDRLIELIKQATTLHLNYLDSIDQKGLTDTEGRAKFIADHLLANGVIVLPCKVGDIIWVKDFMWGLIPCKVDEPYHYVCGYGGDGCTVSGWFADKDIGEWVFLTKEEAEAKLKECEG